jgi:hypothetical protein
VIARLLQLNVDDLVGSHRVSHIIRALFSVTVRIAYGPGCFANCDVSILTRVAVNPEFNRFQKCERRGSLTNPLS